MDVPFTLIIEREEQADYEREYGENRVITVPPEYREKYETYDELGDSKSKGPGPARNFAWDHSRENGYDWHWVMDDNISRFIYYAENHEYTVSDGALFRAMEDFVLQYENVAMAGPRYQMFNIKREKRPPITLNTRNYSCNLIRNDTGYRWAGRYNEDTDLSLRMLKDGWCTILFGLFLQKKVATQELDGGNTENFYTDEGTYPKSRMLKRCHPDVTKISKQWGRWHHRVDYSGFDQQLIQKDDPPEIGDYDFEIVSRDT